ncbi:MAG: hypothetical protein QOF10_5864 [Kribbellaceae bacterium]|nr:hypothetical protein [Kribbellaceae bacterium]
MVQGVHPGRLLAGATMLSLTSLIPVGVAQAAPGDSAAGGRAPHVCAPLVDFDSGDFSAPTVIDNEYLPMVPGTRLTYEGVVSGGGAQEAHQVVFTVTDLVKDVAGVRTRVIYDVDQTAGEVTEAELAFFAQDDAGNVWNLGEYPEEYEGGTFTGAPNVWIHGLEGATGGIHMPADAERLVNGPEYLQGEAPEIDFLDCARVAAIGGKVTVPAGHFTDVLTTYERSPLESLRAIQIKEHAPGVGIVRISARNDPEGETLELVSIEQLGPQELGEVDRAAFQLDRHGHRVSEVYSQTPDVQAEDVHGHPGGRHQES